MSWEADYWNECMRDNDMDVNATISGIQGINFCSECLEDYDEDGNCECMEEEE